MTQFTIQVIEETFLILLSEKSFDKIRVQELVERCGISRNTFYYHYSDIYDMIQKMMDREIERMNLLRQPESFEEGLLCAIQLVVQYKKAFANLLNSQGRGMIEKYLDTVSDTFIEKHFEIHMRGKALSKADKEMLIEIYGAGLKGIMLRWIQKEWMSKEEFAHRLATLFEKTADTAVLTVVEQGK